jgi:hypothetical protein
MSEPKHTPGPWYTNPKPDSPQGLIYQENTGKNIAVCYETLDANLIAAAPELLEACKAAEASGRDVKINDGVEHGVEITHEAWTSIKTAIAKAEGKQ